VTRENRQIIRTFIIFGVYFTTGPGIPV